MAGEMKTYTLKEIEEHVSEDSLWLLIENGVYDVSKFQEEHPGGAEVLFESAGKDATEEFEDIGHSVDARAMMTKYKIGELCEEDRKGKKLQDKLEWPTLDLPKVPSKNASSILKQCRHPVLVKFRTVQIRNLRQMVQVAGVYFSNF